MDLTLAERIGTLLKQRGEILVTAESCTGGGLAYTLTAIPGSSQWFDRSYVTYSNQAKIDLLGVPETLLTQYGAVSREVVIEMAKRSLTLSRTNWSIAITGIAGPEGGTPDKPVGTVWIAWANQHGVCHVQIFHFTGGRIHIRNQAIQQSLSELEVLLNKA